MDLKEIEKEKKEIEGKLNAKRLVSDGFLDPTEDVDLKLRLVAFSSLENVIKMSEKSNDS